MSGRAPPPPPPPPPVLVAGRAPAGGVRVGTQRAPPNAPPQFFVDNKRGEVHELRQLLRLVQAERAEPQKKRDAIKKVIAYMTLGIDVSRLFSEMVMASQTDDLVQKKMIYLYLTNYAESNPDLAILAVNTLQKDCRDRDPTIRGLALRSLCSLRLANMVEYFEPAIRRALEDSSGYVRKTAVIGALKLFHVCPESVVGRPVEGEGDPKNRKREGGMVDALYASLNDTEPLVVTNAIHALNEILAAEGGLGINRHLAINFLNRLRTLSEWGQCAVLTLVRSYVPSSDEELYDIMNVLEDRLLHSSAAVVLATTRCFIDLTIHRPALYRQVLMRLKAPLLTLMSTSASELSYVVLLHVRLLLQPRSSFEKAEDGEGLSNAAVVMGDDYRHFFCRYSDPSYIKKAKLDILSLVASESTVSSIITELSEYVCTEVDQEVAKKSIQALGSIALRLPAAAETAVDELCQLLSMDIESVSAAALTVMRDILRKDARFFPRIARVLERCLQMTNDPEGLCALIWILGEFGEDIDDAPYTLEQFGTTLGPETLTPPVHLELLSAVAKLFVKRPAESQKMFGALLKKIVEETNHPDVRDRALLYWRLLCLAGARIRTTDPLTAMKPCEEIFVPPREPITEMFQEQQDVEKTERLLAEFNTLAVMYGKPSAKFLATSTPIPFSGHYEHENAPSAIQANGVELVRQYISEPPDTADLVGTTTLGSIRNDIADVTSTPTYSNGASLDADFLGEPPAQTTAVDLDDLLGGESTGRPDTELPAQVLRAQPAALDANDYQTYWGSWPIGSTAAWRLKQPLPISDPSQLLDAIEKSLAEASLVCLASGVVDEGTLLKLYLYGEISSNSTFILLEVLVRLHSFVLEVTIRSDPSHSSFSVSCQQVDNVIASKLAFVLTPASSMSSSHTDATTMLLLE